MHTWIKICDQSFELHDLQIIYIHVKVNETTT